MDRPLHLRPDRRADPLAHRANTSSTNARARPGRAINAALRRRGGCRHHPQGRAPRTPAVYEYYRAADLCFVSSLHDGMNLVAKEFVAAARRRARRADPEHFTGAARELPEALIVNPYDADQCAAALHWRWTMPASEQRDRMRLMRGWWREFNVYRWAGRMLLDAAGMRRRGKPAGAARSDGRAGDDFGDPACRASSRRRPPHAGVGLFPRHRRHPAGDRAAPRRRAGRRRPAACSGACMPARPRRSGADQRPRPGRHLPCSRPAPALAGQHGLERLDASGGIHLDATARPVWPWLNGAGRRAPSHPRAAARGQGLDAGGAFRLNPGPGGLRPPALAGISPTGRRGQPAAGQVRRGVEARRPRQGHGHRRVLAEPPFAGRRPVFIGDDVTDEYGFRMVNGSAGFHQGGTGETARAGHRRAGGARLAGPGWRRRPAAGDPA
jgi:hypothetical protein